MSSSMTMSQDSASNGIYVDFAGNWHQNIARLEESPNPLLLAGGFMWFGPQVAAHYVSCGGTLVQYTTAADHAGHVETSVVAGIENPPTIDPRDLDRWWAAESAMSSVAQAVEVPWASSSPAFAGSSTVTAATAMESQWVPAGQRALPSFEGAAGVLPVTQTAQPTPRPANRKGQDPGHKQALATHKGCQSADKVSGGTCSRTCRFEAERPEFYERRLKERWTVLDGPNSGEVWSGLWEKDCPYEMKLVKGTGPHRCRNKKQRK